MKTLDLTPGSSSSKATCIMCSNVVHFVPSLTNTFFYDVLFSLKDPPFISRIRHCCDYVVRLESFEGSKDEHNPVYKDYHGRDDMPCTVT